MIHSATCGTSSLVGTPRGRACTELTPQGANARTGPVTAAAATEGAIVAGLERWPRWMAATLLMQLTLGKYTLANEIDPRAISQAVFRLLKQIQQFGDRLAGQWIATNSQPYSLRPVSAQ